MWKSNKFRGKNGKGKRLTPMQKAYIAGVKAGMARARQSAGRYRGRTVRYWNRR